METLVLVLKNIESNDKAKHDTFCLHSKAETIINDVFESIYTTIISNIQFFKKNFQAGLLIQL